MQTNVDTAAKTLIDQLAKAWDAGDADAYGALFTEDASYVTWVGTYYAGRRDITESHRALFASFLKGTKMFTEVLEVRALSEDTAVVITRGDVAKKRPKTLSKVQTFTVVRRDGGWRLAAFQNTKRKALAEAISFRVQPATRPSR